jgi:hypothetical protein
MAISKIDSKALTDSSVVDADIADGTITSAKLAGSIANAKLANSNVTVNGTSINLGDSGSIPAVSWQSVVVSDGSTVTTMVAGNGYFVNNTSAAGLVKLPISASAGDTVAIKDYAGNFGTNNLTIQRNGHNIQGVANDSLISTNRASLTLVYVDATKGWLYAVESNVGVLYPAYITATGGTVATSGDFKIHTFTGDGCFVVSSVGNPRGSDSVDYLVVAGGGSGGHGNNGGGGGGAGGFREGRQCASAYTASPLVAPAGLPVSATTYPVTVGGGAVGVAQPNVGIQGTSSVFSTITSTGGGGGGRWSTGGQTAGGSGGGSAQPSGTGGAGNTPPTSPSQGNNGGNLGYNQMGGGGGAGAGGTPGHSGCGCGSNTDRNGKGGGGNGVATSISGSPTSYGGGGGGGFSNAPGLSPASDYAPGGTGGGANGGPGTQNGSTNTGGGGGGAPGIAPNSGAGGSGIVIVRYKFQ